MFISRTSALFAALCLGGASASMRGFSPSQHRTLQALTIPTGGAATYVEASDSVTVTVEHPDLATSDDIVFAYFDATCNAALTNALPGVESTVDGTGTASDTTTITISAAAIANNADSGDTIKVSQAALTDVSSVTNADSGETFTFCVRATYELASGTETDFVEVIVTLNAFYDDDALLTGAVTATADGPTSENENTELFGVDASVCVGTTGDAVATPVTVAPGEPVTICLKPQDPATVKITGITTFGFSIGTAGTHISSGDAAVNADTQAAITGAVVQELTTGLACVPTVGASYCHFTTVLKTGFYQDDASLTALTGVGVIGTGVADIQVGSRRQKARSLFMIKSIDAATVEFTASGVEEKEESSCLPEGLGWMASVVCPIMGMIGSFLRDSMNFFRGIF